MILRKWHGAKIYIVWECSLDLGDSTRLPGRNDIWEGCIELVRWWVGDCVYKFIVKVEVKVRTLMFWVKGGNSFAKADI